MFKFSVLSTEKAAGENVLPLRELPCLCLMICVNIIKKAAKEVLAAIFMIFYLTERKFVVLSLDRVTGYEPVGRGFESLWARQVFLLKYGNIPMLHFVAWVFFLSGERNMVHISRADRHRMQQAVFVGAAKGQRKNRSYKSTSGFELVPIVGLEPTRYC